MWVVDCCYGAGGTSCLGGARLLFKREETLGRGKEGELDFSLHRNDVLKVSVLLLPGDVRTGRNHS